MEILLFRMAKVSMFEPENVDSTRIYKCFSPLEWFYLLVGHGFTC